MKSNDLVLFRIRTGRLIRLELMKYLSNEGYSNREVHSRRDFSVFSLDEILQIIHYMEIQFWTHEKVFRSFTYLK